MSEYVDTTGDGAIGEDNVLLANDQAGDKDPSGFGNAFHVQHPRDHWYASATGSPWDCPQPDLGLVPGERTEWNPEPARAEPVLTITSPEDGAVTNDAVTVAGTVERRHDHDATWNPHTSGEDATSASVGSVSNTTGLVTTTWSEVLSPWLVLGTTSTDGTVAATSDDGDDAGEHGPATEAVLVHADGVLVGSQDVRTRSSADDFAVAVELEAGTHVLRVDWEDRGRIIASETVTITVSGHGSGDDGGDGGDGGGDGDDGDAEHPGCKGHPRKGTTPPGLGRCS
jgi:hypothetical protein